MYSLKEIILRVLRSLYYTLI